MLGITQGYGTSPGILLQGYNSSNVAPPTPGVITQGYGGISGIVLQGYSSSNVTPPTPAVINLLWFSQTFAIRYLDESEKSLDWSVG